MKLTRLPSALSDGSSPFRATAPLGVRLASVVVAAARSRTNTCPEVVIPNPNSGLNWSKAIRVPSRLNDTSPGSGDPGGFVRANSVRAGHSRRNRARGHAVETRRLA
jgi:hypothetical protein